MEKINNVVSLGISSSCAHSASTWSNEKPREPKSFTTTNCSIHVLSVHIQSLVFVHCLNHDAPQYPPPRLTEMLAGPQPLAAYKRYRLAIPVLHHVDGEATREAQLHPLRTETKIVVTEVRGD